MKNLWLNVRYAGRLLKKDLGFTFVALLALTLGIGANAAIFSVVYGALLAPLPYPNADQLVMVWSKFNGQRNGVSAGDFLEWKRQSSAFQDIVAWSGNTFSLSVSDHPEPVKTRITSSGFFTMQGIPLSLGRDFAPEEGVLGKNRVLIMTNKLWQERFGSDPKIIGRQVRLNGELYSIVGVLAAGMPDRFESHLFVPLTFRPDQINHNLRWLAVMARLKPGITLQQANANMDGVTKRIAENYPLSNKGWGASVEPLKNDFTSTQTIKNLWLLLGAVGFVLFDRLRQRCESAACTGYHTTERSGTASFPGRNALATLLTILDGECCSGAPGRNLGSRPCIHSVEGHHGSSATVFNPNRSGCAAELAGVVLQFGTNGHGGHSLRLRPSVADFWSGFE